MTIDTGNVRANLVERIVAQLTGRQDKTLGYLQLAITHGLVPPPSARWYAKTDPGFAPLLPPGMHTMDLGELRRLAVDGFPDSTARRRLWTCFEGFHAGISALNVAAELWIGGSFVSSKPAPRDIDLAVMLPLERVVTLTVQEANRFDEILDAAVKEGLETAIFFEGDLALRSYLQGLLAFAEDRTRPCGIAVLQIGQ